MSDRRLSGTRVRNRRLNLGLRQSDVARDIGISASYLNLIEHNRRRISPAVLQSLAQVLDIDPALLEEEPDASFTAPLAEAVEKMGATDVEAGSLEDLVARYPGWARLIATQHRRIGQLEQRVENLGNRLAHDTQIAASLHEVISTATSIRSTASILVETPDLDRDWQSRFHGNIDGDAARLSQSSQELLGLLDTDAVDVDELPALEVAESVMSDWGHRRAEWEEGSDMIEPGLRRDVAAILSGWVARHRADAESLPLGPFAAAARQMAFDPGRLAARFGVPVSMVLRRLSQLPDAPGQPLMGVARCDAAGVVIYQKPVLDFRLPRSGGACPLWPLFKALTQPGRAIRQVLRLPGAARTSFECFAIAEPEGPVAFDEDPRIEATMLVRPASTAASALTVGPGCRLCAIEGCASRRQPSILS